MQESLQNVPLGIIDLGLLKCCQTTAETMEDVVVDESSDETTETNPPLPLASWFKEKLISRYAEMRCRKFRKDGNGNDWRRVLFLRLLGLEERSTKMLLLSEGPLLFCVSEIWRVSSAFANYSLLSSSHSLRSATSLVREYVSLTKYLKR